MHSVLKFSLIFLFCIKKLQTISLDFYDEDDDLFIEERLKVCGPGKSKEPYRYHAETGQCWEGDRRGPCSEGMVIHGIDGINGTCDCKGEFSRLHIYHEETDKCYPIFTKAYCENEEWLTLTTELEPKCLPNPCAQFNDSCIPYDGKCVKIYSKCDPDQSLDSSAKIFLMPNGHTPVCSILSPNFAASNSAPALQCSPGKKITVTGRCKKTLKNF